MKKIFYLLLILTASFGTTLHAKRIYVDSANVSATKNGQSWATAFSNLQVAIDSSKAKDTLWVAKGTYQHYYTATAFAMKDSVKIFGGFLNTHTSFQSRNWTANPTVLKGNGYMVVLNSFLEYVGPEAWLDGFTITGGTKGGMENNFCSPTVNNCTFTGNTNTTASSATAMQNSVCSSLVTNCRFINNIGAAAAVVNGGFGAFPPDNEAGPTFINCVFSGNSGSNAGGITNSGCIVTFTNCDFNSNKSSFKGGAMSASYAIVNITNSRFKSNEATERGGAIHLEKSNSNIMGSSFWNNAAEVGGGICNESDTSIRIMQLSYCSFDSNRVTSPKRTAPLSGTDRLGGGVYNRATANISNCVFRNNAAGNNNLTAGGGGLYCAQNQNNMISTITHCQFYKNKAILVGGLSWWNANASGGGAVVARGNVSDCIFEGNEAVIRGGGLAIGSANSQEGIVNRCQFINNRCERGAGIYANTMVSISNCLIAKNVADSSGGGLEFDVYQNYPGKLVNTTIANNKAPRGAGIYLYAYTPITNPYSISNSIIWGNSTTGIDKLSSIAAPKVTYSLVQGMAADASKVILAGSTNPMFVDTAGANHQLLIGSPCIDTGRNDSLAAVFNTDLLGHSRIYNGRIDLGAYEYGIFTPVATLPRDTTVCSNVKLTFRLPYQSGTSFAWSTGDTTLSINVGTPGTYYVAATNALGVAHDTIVVRHNTAPVVNLGKDTSSCTRVVLDAQNPGATYRWSTGATIQSGLVGSGTHWVIVTDSNGCSASDTIKVTLLPVPFVYLGSDVTIPQGSDITLDAGNPGESYLWSTGATTQTIKANTTGTYSVTVTNSHGCSASDAIVVTVEPVGVNGVTAINGVLNLHPNPARDQVTIRVNDAKLIGSTLSLVDAFGRVVRTVQATGKEHVLSLDGLATGIYLLKAADQQVWKLVKE